MNSKTLFIFTVTVLVHFFQYAHCQFQGLPFTSGFGSNLGFPSTAFLGNGFSRSNAPCDPNKFPVSCHSPLQPTGLTIISENKIEGTVGLNGQLPFLATIGVEGEVPAKGQSNVYYQCGDGDVGIFSEGGANQGQSQAFGSGFGFAPGFGNGLGPALGGRPRLPFNGIGAF